LRLLAHDVEVVLEGALPREVAVEDVVLHGGDAVDVALAARLLLLRALVHGSTVTGRGPIAKGFRRRDIPHAHAFGGARVVAWSSPRRPRRAASDTSPCS